LDLGDGQTWIVAENLMNEQKVLEL